MGEQQAQSCLLQSRTLKVTLPKTVIFYCNSISVHNLDNNLRIIELVILKYDKLYSLD